MPLWKDVKQAERRELRALLKREQQKEDERYAARSRAEHADSASGSGSGRRPRVKRTVRYVSRVWILVHVLQNESSRVRGTGIRNPRAAGQAGAPDGGMAVATR